MEEKITGRTIDFSDIIITPIEQRVKMKLDLEQGSIDYLKKLAFLANQSVNDVMNHLVEDFMAEHLDFNEVSPEVLRKLSEKNQYVILMEKGKPVGKVKLLFRDEKHPVYAPVDICPEKDCSEEEAELFP